MNTNDDMIEEIEDIETPDEKQEEININDAVIDQETNVSKEEEVPTLEELEPSDNLEVSELDNKEIEEEKKDEEETNEEVKELPSKSKAPAIVMLSILLVLDIAALVIYMIGLDKVISFIK